MAYFGDESFFDVSLHHTFERGPIVTVAGVWCRSYSVFDCHVVARTATRLAAACSTLCWVTLPLIWRSHMDDFGWTLVPGMSLLILIPALLPNCFWNNSTASVSDTEESKETDSSSNTVLKRELMNERRADFLFFTGILLIQAMISIGSYWYRMS